MPLIYHYDCNTCSFRFPGGWGCYVYAEDDEGRRHECHHPLECEEIIKILGHGASEEMIQKRTGINTHCVCLDCITQFDVDTDKDELVCPYCGSANMKTIYECVDKPCPKCKAGTIRQTGGQIMV